MKLLLITLILLFSGQSSIDSFSYSVKATGGGKNGFNYAKCDCDNQTGKYTVVLKDAGWEKDVHCCLSDVDKEVRELVTFCDDLVKVGAPASGTKETRNFSATYAIQDAFNFSYKITDK